MRITGISAFKVNKSINQPKHNFAKSMDSDSFSFQKPPEVLGLTPPIPSAPLPPLMALLSMVIGLLMMGGTAYTKGKIQEHKDKKAQFQEYCATFYRLIDEDIKRYQQSHNVSFEKAQSVFIKRFKTLLALNFRNDKITTGLNGMKGFVDERYKLLTSVILPVLETRKSDDAKKLVPNGILLQFEDKKDADVLSSALMEHFEEFGHHAVYLDLKNLDSYYRDAKGSNTDKTEFVLEELENIFYEAEEEHRKYNEYTLLHLKNLNSLDEKTDDVIIDALKNYMEQSASKGVITVFETNDVAKINRALLRTGRCDLKIKIK